MKRREFLKVAGTFALVASVGALTGCGGPGSSGYKDTKTAAYFARKGVTATNFYMDGTLADGTWTGKVMLATLGQDTRYRRYMTAPDNTITGWNVLVVGDTAYNLNDKTKAYQLFADMIPNWTAEQVKSQTLKFRTGQGHFVVPADNGDILSIKKTIANVNGTDYEAEEIEIATERLAGGLSRGYVLDYCFDGDELVYVKSEGWTTKVCEVHANPDSDLVKFPDGYTRVMKGEYMDPDWEF